MFANFEYQLTRDEFVRGLQAVSLSLASQDRWRTVRCLALGAILGVAISVAVFVHPGSFDGILLAIVLTWLPYVFMQMRSVRRWREIAYDAATANLSVTVTDDGVAERHDRGMSQWSWGGVRRIHDLPEVVVIEVVGWHAITLPYRLWAEADDRSEFVKLVSERATSALPDIKSAWSADPTARILSIGAIAAGLNTFALASVFEGRLICPCTIYRMLGQSYALYVALWMAVPFIAAAVAWIITRICLKRLSRSYPRFASALAKLFIAGVCVALLAGPFIKP